MKMENSTGTQPVKRFGVFELDPLSGELRKRGVRIRLQGKPLQILVALMERPGEVVTREQLCKLLYPGDSGTLIDFDNSLNIALRKLRVALGDSAQTPRFIETLPGKGYRFIGSPGQNEETPQAPSSKEEKRRWLAWLPAAGTAVLIVASFLVWRALPHAPRISSLAVLPLENLTGNAGEEYFVDAMTEALIDELAQLGGPRVISRSSAMHYKGTKRPLLPAIARELNVDGVIEGSVTRFGSRVRISAQLINGSTDQHLWSGSYERELTDILALQREVAQAIAREVRIRVTPEEQRRRPSARPVKPEAYEAYLRWRWCWNLGERKKGFQYLQEALRIDPNYALAHAAVARYYMTFGGDTRRIRAAAQQAVALDDSLAEGHAALAALSNREWDWQGAEREYRRALDLNPNSADVRISHGYRLLIALGRPDDAARELLYAKQLDPISTEAGAQLGFALYLAHRHEDAIRELKNVLAMNPNAPQTRWFLGRVYLQKGMLKEALSEFEQSDFPDIGRALFYAKTGRAAEAHQLIPDIPYYKEKAMIHATLGETDEAFRWLERAYERREGPLYWFRLEPEFDAIRSDARYHGLLRRMGLER